MKEINPRKRTPNLNGNSAASSSSSAAAAASSTSGADAAPAKRSKRSGRAKLPTLKQQASELFHLILHLSPEDVVFFCRTPWVQLQKIINIRKAITAGGDSPPLEVCGKNKRDIKREEIFERIRVVVHDLNVRPYECIKYNRSVFLLGNQSNNKLLVLLYFGANPNIGRRVVIKERNPQTGDLESSSENQKPLLFILKWAAKNVLLDFYRSERSRELRPLPLLAEHIFAVIKGCPSRFEEMQYLVSAGHICTKEDERVLCNMVRRSIDRRYRSRFNFEQVNDLLRIVLRRVATMAPRPGLARIHSLPQFKKFMVDMMCNCKQSIQKDPGLFQPFISIFNTRSLVAEIASYLTPFDGHPAIVAMVGRVDKLNAQLQHQGFFRNDAAKAVIRAITTINSASFKSRIVSSGAYARTAKNNKAVAPWARSIESVLGFKSTISAVSSMRESSYEFRKVVYAAYQRRILFAAENVGVIFHFFIINYSLHFQRWFSPGGMICGIPEIICREVEATVPLLRRMILVLDNVVLLFRAIVPAEELWKLNKLLLSECERFAQKMGHDLELCEGKIVEIQQEDHDACSAGPFAGPAP